MKLVIDNVSELPTFEVKARPVAGFKAARMEHDFTIQNDMPGEDDVKGKSGEYVIVKGSQVVAVLTEKQFVTTYQRVVKRTAKKVAK